MWLINCANSNYTLEEFLDDNAPTYAILSHTWGKEEVSFQQMQCLDAEKHPAGFAKIEMCCKTALSQGIGYAWVDTCCIDKTSSSALQEAVNSMFRWYRRAKVCYAYLSDVPHGVDEVRLERAFRHSRWFTRGWTLQELIAPQEVWFYDQSWTICGTKISRKMLISKITGIQQEVLEGANEDLSDYSIAQRMCWASRRVTTRQEDIAYCLLGIFDINMTLIYGEGGQRAFIRLQEQIMQDSDDQSIFAWRKGKDSTSDSSGLLADFPDLFVTCRDIIALRNWHQGEPFQITNRGLRINLPLVDAPQNMTSNGKSFLGALACQVKDEPLSVVGILLAKVHDTSDQYTRSDRGLLSIPIDLLLIKPLSSRNLDFYWDSISSESRSLHRWIYVRKHIQYPKKEELESPGDLVAFRINCSGHEDIVQTTSSYPADIANNWPAEITAPKTVGFRWNPAVWSWHAVILFGGEDGPENIDAKVMFYLVIGWNGPGKMAWAHLGKGRRANAKDTYDRYLIWSPQEQCHAIKLTQANRSIECGVTLSKHEADAKDDRKWYEVDLKIEPNERGQVKFEQAILGQNEIKPDERMKPGEPAKKQNWIKKLTRRDQ